MVQNDIDIFGLPTHSTLACATHLRPSRPGFCTSTSSTNLEADRVDNTFDFPCTQGMSHALEGLGQPGLDVYFFLCVRLARTQPTCPMLVFSPMPRRDGTLRHLEPRRANYEKA